nr:hypothetical protein BHI3_12190 [Bacteriovorax sp. HI3]
MQSKKILIIFTTFLFVILVVAYKYDLHGKVSNNQSRSLASDEQTTPYSFGGSCSSQGSWTAAALSQTTSIKNILISLKDDPNCKGIETVVNQLQGVESSFNQNSAEDSSSVATWEGLPSDINALRELGRSSGHQTKDVLNMLMGKTLDNAVLSRYKNIAIRSDRVARTGLKFVDQALTTLPQFDRCLVERPNQAVALVGGLLKLTSAFASSGENVIGDAGNTIAKLATYMRNSKFTSVLSKLDQTELWMSMSCLLETTTEAYCSARDTYQSLNYAKTSKKINMDSLETNPLEGYFLLTREVPIISSWLQKVQFGATPKLESDTIPKNTTITSFAAFQTKQNQLLAKFAQSAQVIAEESDIDKKKIAVMEMILDLSDTMSGSRESVNFYTKARTGSLIPFFLLGRSTIPPECFGKMAMTAEDYLRGSGVPSQPEFADPSALVLRVGEQLKLINDEAALIAGRYYQNRVIVDNPNLVDESLTSQTITVYQSMIRISKYLGKLIEKSKNERRNLIQIPSMIETKKRLDEVIASYATVRSKVLEYVEMQKEITSSQDKADFQTMVYEDQEIKNASIKIIQMAFERFNVAVQKDTFLSTRLSTYVQKDFAMRIQDSQNISKDQQNLLIASGSSLIDRLNTSYKKDPNAVYLDLSTAQVVNKKNIDAVEEMFTESFAQAISDVKKIADKGKTKKNSKSALDSDPAKAKIHMTTLRKFTDLIYYGLLFDINEGRTSTPKIYKAKKIESQEDANESFNTLRSRLCIQALAFSDQERYKTICKGASLGPVLKIEDSYAGTEAEMARENRIQTANLSVFYDINAMSVTSPLFTQYAKNAQRDVNICAFRNYRRANYAYWMVKEFSTERVRLDEREYKD